MFLYTNSIQSQYINTYYEQKVENPVILWKTFFGLYLPTNNI